MRYVSTAMGARAHAGGAAALTAAGVSGGSELAAVARGLAVMSQLVSRHLFFTAEAARAMPGA